MAVTTELITLHRTAEEPRDMVAGPDDRYGDTPAARRSLGDIARIDPHRIDPDASELDDLTPRPAASTAEASEILMLDDTPIGPSLWNGADDERLGGYQR